MSTDLDCSFAICGYIRVCMNRARFSSACVQKHIATWAQFVREDWGW